MLSDNESLAKKKKEEGNLYAADKNYSMALKCYDQAISYSPQVKEYWFNKGLAHQMLEQNAQALLALDEALKIDPCYQKAIDNKNFVLAKILLTENKYQQAYALLKQCPRTARVELATIESAGYFKAAIFFGSIDLKLTNEGKIKILQFGNGMQSTFQGLNNIGNKNISSGLKESLSVFGLPYAVVDDPGLVSINKLSSFLEFIKQSNISQNHDIDFSKISSYSGIYCSKLFESKLYPNVLAVGDNLSAALIADDNILTHQMFDNFQDYRPATKILPREYFSNLADETIKELDSEIYVLKMPDLARGSGCWFTNKSHLNQALKFLLQPNEFEANILLNSYLQSNVPKKLHKELLKVFFNWRSSNSPFFMIEAYISSKAIVYNNKSYDPTIRVAFLMVQDNGCIRFNPIGAYWQLPKETIEHEDIRLRANFAIPAAEQNYLAVNDSDLELVYRQLSILLPKLFQKIFTFNFEQYRKKLITSSKDSEKKYGYYITTRIANQLGQKGYLAAGLELLNSIKDGYVMPYKVYHERGLMYHNNDCYEKAIEQYSEALKLYSNIPTYYRRGSSYYALGMLDKALDDLKRAASGSPDPTYLVLYEQVKQEIDLTNYVSPKTNPSLSIDLHGRSVKEAKTIVYDTFKKAIDQKIDQLTVITGIGNHKNRDGSRGVLFKSLPKWIRSYSFDIKSIKQDMGAYEIKFDCKDGDSYSAYLEQLRKQFCFLESQQATEFVDQLEQQAQSGKLESRYLLSSLHINGILVPKNITKGLLLLTEIAANNVDAQLQLGIIFASDLLGVKDYKKAIKWLFKAAEKNHPRALFELGKMHWLGCGIIKNDVKAIEYLTLAANCNLFEILEEIKPFLTTDHSYFMEAAFNGKIAAAHSLGDIYLRGDNSVQADGQLATKYYLIAAKANIVAAQVALAKQYFFGWGIEKNEAQGFFWFEKAALAGDLIAQYYLGLCYDRGLGIESDLIKACHWYEKSEAQGDLDAKLQLAYGHILGRYYAQDITLGISKLTILAEQDHVNSLFLLGLLFLGKILDQKVPQDIIKGFTYIIRAAEFGKMQAQTLLAKLYATGDYCEKDEEKVTYWLRKGAAQQDPESMFLLATQIELQRGFATFESLEFLHKSAELGFTKAESTLGISYLEGVEGESGENILQQDINQAIKWLEKAAKDDCDSSQFILGRLYLWGDKELLISKNYSKGIEYLKSAAKNGNSDANTGLGFCYMEGVGVVKDITKAKHYFSLAAVAGDQAALQNLGYLLQQESNSNTRQLDQKTVKKLALAAEKGSGDAQYELSLFYIKEKDSNTENFGAGMYWLHRCALQSHPGGIYLLKRILMQENINLFLTEIKQGLFYEYMLRQDTTSYPNIPGFEQLDFDLNLANYNDPVVQRNLGIKYRFGHGDIANNYDKAIKWLQEAAKQNDPEALYNLGAMYQAGQGVIRDPGKAIYWFQQAADLGNSDAQFVLGMLYKAGDHVAPNQVTAVKWLKKAAEQGDTEAQFFLGSMYRDGEGVQKCDREAIKWLKKAADQGDPRAQSDLGVMYQTTGSTLEEQRAAVKYYQKAAAQGNANAQFNLGCMYQFGQGVTQDSSKAIYWFEKAANQGQIGAQSRLGALYLLGTDVPKNSAKALEYLQKAANQGDANAMYNLGLVYQTGQGVLQDYHKAMTWYKKSAKQGNSNAQNNLGFMYQNGEGVATNDEESIKWYQKAAIQGNTDAQENLQAMLQKLKISFPSI